MFKKKRTVDSDQSKIVGFNSVLSGRVLHTFFVSSFTFKKNETYHMIEYMKHVSLFLIVHSTFLM